MTNIIEMKVNQMYVHAEFKDGYVFEKDYDGGGWGIDFKNLIFKHGAIVSLEIQT